MSVAKVAQTFGLLVVSIIFLGGCVSSSSLKQERPYRDPLTYSFEAYTPYTEEDPLLQLMTQVKESSRQIKEWEKKHLW